ncbi:phosphopyruvate hydratase [Patescibacteria group bacterium]|nr:phosphopyruvate hydratase [Patescibacteria group bacterium]
MSKIKLIRAREILDSRGNPTIETEVLLENGIVGIASVPSGASTGKYEAFELRDNDKNRYGGLGVKKAVNNVNKTINTKLKSSNIYKQEFIDYTMIDLDGTKDKSKLGANAILSVSLACARAGAASKKTELFRYISKTYRFKQKKFTLPTPCFNIFNGGKHADTNLDFQEFLIVPLKSKIKFSEKVRIGAEIFHELAKVLKKNNLDTDVGNEGGYAPDINSSIDALDYIMSATILAGYEPHKDIGIGIDVGSSELYNPKAKQYIFKLDSSYFTSLSLIDLYENWLHKYPIVYIEDGLAEDDWQGWQEWTVRMNSRLLIIGDDLFTTNIDRLCQGIEQKAGNTILIKPNQVGTLTETIQCIKLAQANKYKIMVSHRSGETCDDFIADLAVATGANFIKSGALSRSERLAKYNRLMKIEEILQINEK